MACRELIDRANENGGPDNITVIVARFEGDGLHVCRKKQRRWATRCSRFPGSTTPTTPRQRFVEGPTAPFRRRNTGAMPAAGARAGSDRASRACRRRRAR